MDCNLKIIFDPPSKAYHKNKFFLDSEYNRDDCLLPNIRLKSFLEANKLHVDTFDFMPSEGDVDYYSFGILSNIEYCLNRKNTKMKAFFIMEPPCVEPNIYSQLPRLTKIFESVYIHNTHGDGYSLIGVDKGKLKKLYWAPNYDHVLDQYWGNTNRIEKIVVINSNKKPKDKSKELYSARIDGIVQLSKYNFIDLYGMGWDQLIKTTTLWPPFILNRRKILSLYKGVAKSKYAILSRYEYCLCYENDIVDSYITEKIFDCFYTGVIPIYLGAPDITDFLPKESFIDARDFKDYFQMYKYLSQLSNEEKHKIKAKGREFIEGRGMSVFYNSLINIFKNEYNIPSN